MLNYLKPYIIGETAYNHQGDIRYLYKMIADIAKLNLSAVKFHLMLNPLSYAQKNHPIIEEIKKWLFSEFQWKQVFNYTQKKNLDIVALCDDVESMKFINKNYSDIFAIEIHSTGLNDYYLLKEAIIFPGKIILGVGGSSIDEIEYAVDFIRTNKNNDILLMYGFQSYPTDYKDINLSKMLKLRSLFDLDIGYADHTSFNDQNNEIISCMAAVLGFNILEKHYTPNPGETRIDFHSAVGFEKMKTIKKLMELSLIVYGTGDIKMTNSELAYGNTGPMKKAIVAKTKIKKGEKLTLNNLYFKRTKESSPIKQLVFQSLIGLEVLIDIEEDEIIDFSKINYEFKHYKKEDFTNIKEKG